MAVARYRVLFPRQSCQKRLFCAFLGPFTLSERGSKSEKFLFLYRSFFDRFCFRSVWTGYIIHIFASATEQDSLRLTCLCRRFPRQENQLSRFRSVRAAVFVFTPTHVVPFIRLFHDELNHVPTDYHILSDLLQFLPGEGPAWRIPNVHEAGVAHQRHLLGLVLFESAWFHYGTSTWRIWNILFHHDKSSKLLSFKIFFVDILHLFLSAKMGEILKYIL